MKSITLVLFGFSCVMAGSLVQYSEAGTTSDTKIASAYDQTVLENMPLFYNLHELQEWATSSTWGGGTLETVFLDSLPIYIADRCFTSGLRTSEITVYIERDRNFEPVFHIPIQHDCFHTIQVRDSLLVIIQHNMRDEEIEFATLTVEDLFGFQPGMTVLRIPSDIDGIDLIVTYSQDAASRDYVAETFSSISLTDPYAVDREAHRGLIFLVFEDMKRIEEFVICHEDISAVIQIRYDMDVYDRTDVIFLRTGIVMVHTTTTDAGFFTSSCVYNLPLPENGFEYISVLSSAEEGHEHQLGLLYGALLFYHEIILPLGQ